MKLVHFIELLLLFGVLILIGVPLFRGLSGVSLFSDRNKLLEEYKHLLVKRRVGVFPNVVLNDFLMCSAYAPS